MPSKKPITTVFAREFDLPIAYFLSFLCFHYNYIIDSDSLHYLSYLSYIFVKLYFLVNSLTVCFKKANICSDLSVFKLSIKLAIDIANNLQSSSSNPPH